MSDKTPQPFKASVSDISGFSSCRRQWLFNRVWRQAIPPKPLWIGQVVHAGLDAYYRQDRSYEAAEAAMKKYVTTECEKLQHQFPFSDVYNLLIGQAEEAAAYVYNYSIYDAEWRLNGEVITVERPFKIKLPSNPNYALSGRIDLVLRAPTGGLLVVDHKTMGSKPTLSGLDVDEQITAYSWAVKQLYGEVPEAVVYNVVIKAMPQEPAVLKSGGLSKAKGQTTTAALYRAKIAELGLNEDDYVDVLRELDDRGWDAYFARVASSRTEEELNSFERRCATKLRDIHAIVTNPSIEGYPSPSSFTCSYCPFLAPCKVLDEGGDYESIMDNRFVRWENDR